MSPLRSAAEIGPVQLLAVGFGPDAEFEGRALVELERLERRGTIRVLDLLFVGRDADSDELVVLGRQSESLGGIIGALLGFEFEGEVPEAEQPAADELPFGLGPEEVVGLAAGIGPGQAAAFMLFEHVWARELKHAIRSAGGVPLGEGFLTPEAIAAVAPELAAMAAELDALQLTEPTPAGG
jgi:hypothetical protein